MPSITVEDLYDVSGEAMLYRNSKFDHMAMVRAFSEDIVDCIPLILYPQEDRHIFFILNHPVPAMEYDCFIIDADGNDVISPRISAKFKLTKQDNASHIAMAINLQNVLFTKVGKYDVHLEIDNEKLDNFAFEVHHGK